MLNILGIYDFTAYKHRRKLIMAFGMFAQDILGALILLFDDSRHFGVYVLGAFLAVWL